MRMSEPLKRMNENRPGRIGKRRQVRLREDYRIQHTVHSAIFTDVCTGEWKACTIHTLYIYTHTGLSSIIKVQVIKIQVYIEGYEDNYMEGAVDLHRIHCDIQH